MKKFRRATLASPALATTALAIGALLTLSACANTALPETGADQAPYMQWGFTESYAHRDQLLAQLNGGADVAADLTTTCYELANYAGAYDDAEWLRQCELPTYVLNSYTNYWEDAD